MRSIRRTLTLYLFALLAGALGVVWIVLDQVTARVLDAREAADRALIGTRYESRSREERARVDQALLDQARLLGRIAQEREHERFDAERGRHRAAMGVVPLALGPLGLGASPLAQAAWTATANYNPFPVGRPNLNYVALFRTHFANLPIPDEYLQHFEDENRTVEYFQINTAAGREWRSTSLGTRKLPFDPGELDAKLPEPGRPTEAVSVPDWKIGNAELGAGKEPVRRVVYQMPHLNSSQGIGWFRPRGPGGGSGRDDRREDRKDDRPPGPGGPQRSMVGAFTSWALTGFGGAPPGGIGPPPPTPTLDALPRLFVQCARPQRAIDAVIARFTEERDAELAQLADEIAEARATVRVWASGVGLAAFLGVALGGPFLVGRGLVPVGKLSDAVSRVNEKDFKLNHDATDMAVELVPIHGRLTQTLDQLQRAFSREKQAVADISHELRTPIAALMATIDVSLRKPRTPEQYRATLEECRVISKQLGQLVERIMTLASLDAGNDCVMVSRTDVADLALGCVSVIRPLAAANNVAVELHAGDPADLELDTDSGKLREVVMNLLHNAVEYNTPGGLIELRASRSLDAVVLEVRDTGIGMSAEVRDKIFERFYRADPSRHATGVHAGLGLAIVKEYVSRLGGAITVESEEGKGSTFRVTLPVPATAPATETTADEPLTAGV